MAQQTDLRGSSGSHVARPSAGTRIGGTKVSDRTRSSSLVELAGTGARLAPKQLQDNVKLLTHQGKEKGIKIGIGAGLGGLGLGALAITFVSLVVAMIAAFGSVSEMWVPALWVALATFILGALLIGVGAALIAGAAPFVPEETIRGIKHDLGYLREGNNFDPVEYDRLEAEKKQRAAVEKQRRKELAKQAKKEQKAAIKRGEAPKGLGDNDPTASELRHRMELRRRHLGDIRSGVDEKTNVAAQLDTFKAFATGKVSRTDQRYETSPIAPYSAAARAGVKANEASEFAKERWQPIGLLGASVATMAVLSRRLFKKNDK